MSVWDFNPLTTAPLLRFLIKSSVFLYALHKRSNYPLHFSFVSAIL